MFSHNPNTLNTELFLSKMSKYIKCASAQLFYKTVLFFPPFPSKSIYKISNTYTTRVLGLAYVKEMDVWYLEINLLYA